MRPHARHWEALLLLVSDFERAEQPEWQTLPPNGFAREIAPRLLELPADAIQDFEKSMEQSVALKRFGQAEEVARAVLFLASSADSSYIVGTEIFVDGGLAEL